MRSNAPFVDIRCTSGEAQNILFLVEIWRCGFVWVFRAWRLSLQHDLKKENGLARSLEGYA
jgi:hypothetical protein